MTLTSRQSQTLLAAAVLYEHDDFREPLRGALAAAGAAVASEHRISDFRPEDFATIKAQILVVNLEPALLRDSALLEAIAADRFPGRIIFNDGEATARLIGSDKARWARHLAAKITGVGSGLPPRPEECQSQSQATDALQEACEVWVLGASIGGPEAVRSFLANLDRQLPIAFILAQHIGVDFVELMARQLNQASSLPVRCARAGDVVQAGQVLVVPVDRRFSIDSENRVKLEQPASPAAYSPCIDQVLRAVAAHYSDRVNAIIFSGMAADGVAAATELLAAGREVWVQDPKTCVVSSMVEGTLGSGQVQYVGDPLALAQRLNARAWGAIGKEV